MLNGPQNSKSKDAFKILQSQTIGEDGVKERNGKSEVSGAAAGNFR